MGKITKAFKDNFDKALVIRGIAAIAAVVIMVWFFYFNTPSLKNIGEKYGDDWFCTVADDGSYLTIDTDPLDLGEYITDGSDEAIQNINKELGFPDSVYAQMISTRALDGVQTYEKNGVNVQWTFHPDNGLEVIYSVE